MKSRARYWMEAAVSRLPNNPAVRLATMLLAAFVAVAGAVQAYRGLVSDDPVLSPAIVNVNVPSVPPATDPTASLQPTMRATAEKSGYLPLWECVPPWQRGYVDDVDRTPRSQSQLNDALLFWSANGTARASTCLADLLRAGASPDAASSTSEVDYLSGPALHSALSQFRWENARMLLKAGANTNLETVYKKDGRGKLALDMAIQNRGPADILEAIRARGGKSAYDKPAK